MFGSQVSLPGFAALLFVGFFTFFLGKISADTIMQQSMPDDFRGRAFALFDIAYNLGFIIPALILSFVWIEDDATRTRAILVASGVVFLATDDRDLPVVAADPRAVRAAGRPGRHRLSAGSHRRISRSNSGKYVAIWLTSNEPEDRCLRLPFEQELEARLDERRGTPIAAAEPFVVGCRHRHVVLGDASVIVGHPDVEP